MTAPFKRSSVESILADHAKRLAVLNATPCEEGVLTRNLGDIGMSGSSTRTTSYTHTIQFEDVQVEDGILVCAMAPSLPVALGTQGFPVSCTDSAGNSYSVLLTRDYQHSPALVNTGAYVVMFYCRSSSTKLLFGTDTITVSWSASVFDRTICAWLVRHDGGANVPTVLASTSPNNMAVYASSQVTLTSPAWTPNRDGSLEFALLITVKTGGLIGFGSVGGYDGFYQSSAGFRRTMLSSQEYWTCRQTHGADAYALVAGSVSPNEIDLGKLDGGVLVTAFNGVGQAYVTGASAWKGIILLGLD